MHSSTTHHGIFCMCIYLLVTVVLQAFGASLVPASANTTSSSCQPREEYLHLLADLNLTSDDNARLDTLCLSSSIIASVRASTHAVGATYNAIPDGVQCEQTTWCDSGGICSTVCKRGTVLVEPWLQYALKYQRSLAQQQPLCHTQLPGTHNSGITAADGYGNRDAFFQQYLAFMKWAGVGTHIRTNNQWLSITDQLNLGVRVVELDTHWVQDWLRIAHCGGLHVQQLDDLVAAINLLARVFHHSIRWDTETVGCQPSLSSIPALEQRTLLDALQEVAAWMQQDVNRDEFVLLYFDDQSDLQKWGKVPDLLHTILQVFDEDIIVTPSEWQQLMQGRWPPIATLLAMGKRLLFVSGEDYGADMAPLILPRAHTGCGWHEPHPDQFRGPPQCTFERPGAEWNSSWLSRVSACELMYGPFNCDFALAPQRMVLDTDNLPTMTQCGINFLSPDGLTPQRAAAMVWAWAPGHPFWVPASSCQEAAGREAAHCLQPLGSTSSSSHPDLNPNSVSASGSADTSISQSTLLGAELQSTGSSSTGPGSTGSASTGSASTGSASTGSSSARSASTGSSSTGPGSTGSASTGSASTASASTGSAPTASASTASASTGSASTRSSSTGPGSTGTGSSSAARLTYRRLAGAAAAQPARGLQQGQAPADDAGCAAMSAEDGRWRRVACGLPFLTACRLEQGDPLPGQSLWVLSGSNTAPSGSPCPDGYSLTPPLTPQENTQLQELLQQAGMGAAFLALKGPDFALPHQLLPQQMPL